MIRKLVLSLVAVLGVAAMSVAQNLQVSGRVSGEDGAPIIGATVLVEGTTVGTSTNAAGEFTLRAPSNGNLAISFIGYESQVVPVNGQTSIEVVLTEDTAKIDDVIVVAFGEAKKEAFTGSAAVVKSDDIAKVQTSNAAQALAGKVAGVQLTNSSGQPGAAPTIRVRGFSSISAGQSPLIIVDGAPYEGDLNNINSNDIESMTVLKDAASNALYGARGANGVIMITTKRAKVNDATITVDAKWGVNSRATKRYDYIDDPAQYYELHYAALYNYYTSNGSDPADAWIRANNNLTGSSGVGGLGYQVFTVPAGQFFIGQNGRVNPNATLGRVVRYGDQDYYLTPDDWDDEAYKSGFRQEYNVSMSGATERSNVYASFGYLNNKGIVDNSDMYRYTARLRADFQAKKWLKIGANVNYTNFNWNSLNNEGESSSTGNVFAFTEQIAPIYPLYVRDGNGKIMYDEHGLKMYDYGDGMNAGLTRPVFSNSNALSDLHLNVANSEGNAMTGSIFADVTPIEGLKITVKADMNLDETRATQTSNKHYGQFAPTGGTLYKAHSRIFSYNFQQLASYSKTFKDVHTMDIMVGHENYVYESSGLSAQMSGMIFDDNTELANGVTVAGATSSVGKYNVEGYFGRVQYDFDERIFVSGSYRRDASSNFHPDNRWGNFWSAGAAWILSRESWYESKWLDMLKIKFSIGSQGNDSIGSYRYVDTYSFSNFNGEGALVFNAAGNKDITWETNTNMNAGIEFDMFKGRLSGSLDYFYRTTTDMLFSFPVAPSFGYSSYYANVGDMRNSGIELALNAVLLNKKNIQWDFNVNMTHLKNKITMLPEKRKTTTTAAEGVVGFASGSYFYGEGESLYTFYMPKYAGVSNTGEPQWYKYTELRDDNGEIMQDANGNNIMGNVPTTNYSEATDYLCGNAVPDLYGGFGTNLRFFGVDVSVNFTYQIGGLTYDQGYASAMGSPTESSAGSNWHKDILKAWAKETNPNSTIPRLQFADEYTTRTSDRFLVDASYLNIQNIQVGYTFPRKWANKIGVQMLRVYLACDNVYYWSYREGLDPRYSYAGSSNNTTYAPIRTISGGITVQF